MSFKIVPLPEFLSQEFPPVRTLCEPYIEEGALAFIYGAPGSQKSWVAMDIARKTSEAGYVVLYIAEEGRKQKVQERFRKLGATSERLLCMVREGFQIDKPENIAWLLDTIRERKVALVIIDPLADTWVIDESDQTAVVPVRNSLKTLTATGVSLLIVHHSTKLGWPAGGKKGRPGMANLRGSGVLAGSAELVMELVEAPGSSPPSATLHVHKAKDLDLTPAQRRRTVSLVTHETGLRVQWSDVTGSGTASSKPEDDQDRILRFVRANPGQSKSQIARAVGRNKDRVLAELDALHRSGFVRFEKGPKNSSLVFLTSAANSDREGAS
jgi:hypothetical protein